MEQQSKFKKCFFLDKKYSPEEIEKKRLLALERRQQAQLKTQTTSRNSPIQQSNHDSTNVIRSNKTNNRFNPIETKNFFGRTSVVTGKCYMISNERFALEISSFVPAVIETFKTILSRTYGYYLSCD